jgi:hypothetical protein
VLLEEISIFSSSDVPLSTTTAKGFDPDGKPTASVTEKEEALFEIFALKFVLNADPVNSLLSIKTP